MAERLKDIGEILDGSYQPMMHNHGTLTTGDSCEYSLNTTNSGEPLIRSSTTGNLFVIAWNDIVSLAQEHNIDEEQRKK